MVIESNQNMRQVSIMRKFLAITLLLLILVVTIWISLLQFRTPEVISKSANSELFSAERALNYLKDFAVEPHPLGSKEHDGVKNYLMTTLSDLGLSPTIQKVDNLKEEMGINYEEKLENIVVKIPGENSSGTIMLVSHYDSEEGSPGAGDAGSAVAGIVETARILAQGPALKNDLILLLTDGEENGLYGAQTFVSKHPWAKDVGLVFNFEARGSSGPSVLFETNVGNDRLIAEFAKAVPNPVAHSSLNDLYKLVPRDTDLSVFKYWGMYGLNFAFFGDVINYHTPNDSIENLNIGSLQHHGDYMIHLVQHFGNLELVSKEDGDRIFFNIIGKKLITYSEQMVLPIMIFSTLLYILTFIHGYMLGKLEFSKTALGCLFVLIKVIIVFSSAYGVWWLISKIFIDSIATIEGELRVSNPVFVVFIITLICILSLIYQLLSKRISVYNLTMGGYFVWLLLVIVTSIYFKGSSYIFVWPLIFGAIGYNLFIRLKSKSLIKGYVISIGFAIPGILITVPVLYLVYLLFTLDAMGVLLGITSLLAVFLIPVLSTLNLYFIPSEYRERVEKYM